MYWTQPWKIDDGSIGFPEAEPIEFGGPDLPYFVLADDAFALKTWLMMPYPLKGKGKTYQIANYRISTHKTRARKLTSIFLDYQYIAA